jgi:beta-galactosidase
MKRHLAAATAVAALAIASLAAAQAASAPGAASPRERLSMDMNWQFAFGNATDPTKDFDPSPIGNNNYFAKAGNSIGAAATDFDDRAWRTVNLPHDWAVELPFDSKGTASHGSKAIGKAFPQNSVGWYRKSFSIPNSDLGKKISLEFDGVFRDSQVWVNGFYLGRESSGYASFSYDITDYLNYGGNNVIAVRVDATLEEGWFYEGAGIYRHVWLTKTAPVHVAHWGTFVSTEVTNGSATVTARATVANDGTNDAPVFIDQRILDATGNNLQGLGFKAQTLKPGAKGEITLALTVSNPHLWSPETPYMYKLITTITSGGAVVDRYETPFGIRTVRFDANEGFFLNGKRVELKGLCVHQDHAGVGGAIPDELNAWRLEQLKKMGANAIRTSHGQPSPEFLDDCDRMGFFVMDETRRAGINDAQLDGLQSMMLRDRNHPSVVIWSLCNEEFGIEGNLKGARIMKTMQTFAQNLDPTRRFTCAISGGWGNGSSLTIDVMGFNYYNHGNTDDYHAKFPNQPSVGTEDGSTFGTRGVYLPDSAHQHSPTYDISRPAPATLAELTWEHYSPRPYVSGYFVWAGFDYRGEPGPDFTWPAIGAQFGLHDLCGFPKDLFYYYQSVWSDKPVLHLLPHWNWAGMEGRQLYVYCDCNCEEVELFLNGASQGRKTVKPNALLSWPVKYAPGTLLARAYNKGAEVLTSKVETTGEPAAVYVTPHKSTIQADGGDVAIIAVQANDAQGRMVPTASNPIAFNITGPGRIIGVGNGDPSSHEADQYVPKSAAAQVDWRFRAVNSVENRPEIAPDFDDSSWQSGLGAPGGRGGRGRGAPAPAAPATTNIYLGSFELQSAKGVTVSLLLRDLGEQQWIYINGKTVAQNVARAAAGHQFDFDSAMLRPGKNVITIIASPMSAERGGRGGQAAPARGSAAVVKVVTQAESWKRNLFNGLAQVIVQSTGQPGEITLTATSGSLTPAVLKLQSQSAPPRPGQGIYFAPEQTP